MVLLFASITLAGESVRLEAATRSFGDVTLEFPAVEYRPPAAGSDVRVTHAAAVSEAVGITVDPQTDLFIDAQNRLLFRHPTQKRTLLKIYKTSAATPMLIAKSMQRELALQRFLRGIGVAVATIDEAPALLARGVAKQRLVDGVGMDELYPEGYTRGADAAIDRMLDTIDVYDETIARLVRQQLGLNFRNATDCRTMRTLGFDLGRCFANVFVDRSTWTPTLVDW